MASPVSTYQFCAQLIKTRLFWSVFLLVLIHFSGAIGMVYFDTDLFASMTPYNLGLMFLLLILNERVIDKYFLTAFILAFLSGLGTELVGINTGMLFGNYSYGDILGLKFYGVPILIGINWFTIVYCAYVSAGKFLGWIYFRNSIVVSSLLSNHLLQAFFTALLTTIFDWFMEPVAVRLGFWSWKGDEIPLFNYACWFSVSLLLSLGFSKLKLSTKNSFSLILLIVQSVFFIFLRIFLD